MGPIVRETGCGDLCDPEDPADIARAISMILDATPERRAAYRAACLAAARGEYSWERQAVRLLAKADQRRQCNRANPTNQSKQHTATDCIPPVAEGSEAVRSAELVRLSRQHAIEAPTQIVEGFVGKAAGNDRVPGEADALDVRGKLVATSLLLTDAVRLRGR